MKRIAYDAGAYKIINSQGSHVALSNKRTFKVGSYKDFIEFWIAYEDKEAPILFTLLKY